MTPALFVERRRVDWERLATLCDAAPKLRAGKVPAGLGVSTGDDPLAELARLYRRGVADLGRLRTLVAAEPSGGGACEPTLAWLNALVTRAHGQVYVARKSGVFSLLRFIGADFPREVRRATPWIALAAVLLLSAGVATYVLCEGDLTVARAVAGTMLDENAKGFASMGAGRDGATDTVMTAFYISNNVRVAFVAFALGITAGLGTIAVLIENGAVLGVTVALVHHRGTTDRLLAFVASHSPFELTAIVIAGAAGLQIGHSIIAPGPFTRLVALRRTARSAVSLVGGAAFMLLVAAFFEAWVSPSSLAPETKWRIGGLNAAMLILYLGLAGRAVRGAFPKVHE